MDHVADFSFGDVIKVHNRQLDEFEKIARANNKKKRYRLCLHDSPENELQEMLICMTQGDYSRPHKHINMPETHTIIQGREAVVLFSDEGEIVDAFLMDRENGYISYRINADVYHMIVLLSDCAIEYEAKPGPFIKDNNIFPSWAPDGNDIKQAMDFVDDIRKKFQRFL